MKLLLSLALVASLALAEPPAFRQNRYYVAAERQEAGPYQARGWRPDGPAFELPQRQRQAPDQGYGAPSNEQFGKQQVDQGYGAPANQQFGRQQQQGYNSHQVQQFGRQQQQQQPRQQYGPPQQPGNQYGPPPQQPGNQYGPPQQEYPAPSAPFPSTTEYPELEQPTTVSEFGENEAESSTSKNEFEEDQDIDQPQQQSQRQEQGQYYVALPDGRLQRVQYVSRQDLEAMKYFAKIKAENVEPLRGPIYAYAPLQELQVGPGQLQVAAPPSTLTVTAEERRPEKLRQPKVEIKPLAQVQYQHDNAQAVAAPVVAVSAPSAVLPLSSSYTTFTANYAQQLPATVPVEDRIVLAYP